MNPWLSGLANKKILLVLLPLLAVAAFLLINQLNGVPNHPDRNVLAVYRDGLITQEQVVEHYRMVPPADQSALRSVEGVRQLIQDLAVHAVVEKWATERQVDAQDTFRRAMKDAADVVTLHDVAQRMHEFDVKVEESEIQKYFDDHRDQFKDQSLTQVKEQIRNILHAQKEQTVVDDFLKQLRANATVTVNADLLDVPPPTEAELLVYYQDHLDTFREPDRVRVDEIRVKAKDKADRALARIQAGEDFSQVALETNDLSFVPNGDLIGKGVRSAIFDANVFILGEGQVSKVFQDGEAYLVIRVAEKRAGRLKSLDEVHESLAAKLRGDRESSNYAEKKNQVLLSVNGIRYTLGDFLEEYNALPAEIRAHHNTREEKRQLVDGIADRLLILQSVPARMAQSQNQKEMSETRQHVLAQILHDEEPERIAQPSRVAVLARALFSRVGHAIGGFFTDGAGATALADIRAAFGHLLSNPHLGKMALGLVVALYLLSGVYIVNPGEEAVVRRFGQVTQPRVGEGLHYRLPWPIERADVVNVSQIRREGIGLRPPEHEVSLHPAEEPQILTGDENIISVKVIVQYRIKDPADYMLNVDYDANTLIRNTVREEIVTLGGRSMVDDLLTTGRPDLQRAILANAQKTLDNYQSGLQLVSVNLQEVYPPQEVADAFRNVSSAREEKEATINDAMGYANSVLPKARGDAQRTNQEAQSYVAQVTNRAKGDVQRFSDVLKEYRQNAVNHATDVTRYRYFVETMEQVLAKVRKYVVDPRSQNIRIVQ